MYEDDRSLSGLKLPLQVMIGNENRHFPSYLNTEEPDILTLDDSEDEPRLKMSCGHALCKKTVSYIDFFLSVFKELTVKLMFVCINSCRQPFWFYEIGINDKNS